MTKYEGVVGYRSVGKTTTYKTLETYRDIANSHKEIRTWYNSLNPDERKTFKWLINAYNGSKLVKTYQGTSIELGVINKIDTQKMDVMNQTISKKIGHCKHELTINITHKIPSEYMPKLMTNIKKIITKKIKDNTIAATDSMKLDIDYAIQQTPHKKDTMSCLVYDSKTHNEIAYIDIPYFVKMATVESLEIERLKRELFKAKKRIKELEKLK